MNLGEIDNLETQVVWHAAALARSEGAQERDLLIIDWPSKPLVSIGFHQFLDAEIDLDYCTKAEIDVFRRACGGGGVYLDGNQVFYHPVNHISSKIIPRAVSSFYETLLAPVIKTYQDFGVEAYYKPVNDILVGNKKISGNGAALFESAMILTGNFIQSFPRETMARVLKVPDEKFRDKVLKGLQAGISSFFDETGEIIPTDKLIETFTQNFEEMIGVTLEPGELSNRTLEIMEVLKKKYRTDKWRFQVSGRHDELVRGIKITSDKFVVQALHKSPGGLIRTLVEFEAGVIKDVMITGDFWIIPEAAVAGLEERLVGVTVNKESLVDLIQKHFEENNVEAPGTTSEDIAKPILDAFSAAKV